MKRLNLPIAISRCITTTYEEHQDETFHGVPASFHDFVERISHCIYSTYDVVITKIRYFLKKCKIMSYSDVKEPNRVNDSTLLHTLQSLFREAC